MVGVPENPPTAPGGRYLQAILLADLHYPSHVRLALGRILGQLSRTSESERSRKAGDVLVHEACYTAR